MNRKFKIGDIVRVNKKAPKFIKTVIGFDLTEIKEIRSKWYILSSFNIYYIHPHELDKATKREIVLYKLGNR